MNNNSKGHLVVLSGFSGAGKGTLLRELLRSHDNYCLSISATTRSPRMGETDGKDYFFISKDEFEKRISEDAFIEYAQYVKNYYGTPKEFVFEQLERGKDVILEIEIQGALKIKAKYPDVITVFVMPPDAATLMQRLANRGTETKEEIIARLARAAEESRWIDGYEYIIINDDLQTAVYELDVLLASQHKRVSDNIEIIRKVQEDMRYFLQGSTKGSETV